MSFWTLPGEVFATIAGLKRGVTRDELTRYSRYRVKLSRGGSVSAAALQKGERRQGGARGDHLTCAYLSGSMPLYIRLGDESNPFIRLREGLVIKRVFTDFLVRCGTPDGVALGAADQALHDAHAELYSSWGPLLELPAKHYGFRRDMLGLSGSHPGTGFVPLTTLLTKLVDPLGRFVAVGRNGGTMLLKNTSLATTLSITGSGPFASIAAEPGFPIGPGETLELKLEDVAISGDPSSIMNGFLLHATAACTFSVLLSSQHVDILAPEEPEIPGDM